LKYAFTEVLLILDRKLPCFNLPCHSKDTSWTFN